MHTSRRFEQIEADIDAIERRIFAIKDEMARLSDASADLSTSAAIERARNAGLGRGLGGALFGAKYRAAARRAAASGNAAIARDVANKRAAISRAKQEMRVQERELRAALRDLKAELKEARNRDRELARVRSAPPPSPLPAAPVDIKAELQRLKALHQQGRLDAAAYERARVELMRPHVRT